MPQFELDATYSPTADQPAAIASLAEGIRAGERGMTLLGATLMGSMESNLGATVADKLEPK